MEISNMRELLRKARNMESPNCLSPNEAEQVIKGMSPDEVMSHLETCLICKTLIAIMLDDSQT